METIATMPTVPISIHTTARVVTSRCIIRRSSRKNFNPHHRTGGDGKSNQKNAYHPAFYQYFCTNNYNKNFLIYYINPTHPTKIKCEPPRLFMFTSHSHFFVDSCLLSVFHIIKGSRISILSFTPICSTLFL